MNDDTGVLSVGTQQRLGLLAAMLLLPLAGHAQDSPATQLNTVTVTAERHQENIQDVPISISTLGGDYLDLLNSSGEDVRVLSARVPSLNIESSFGRAFPRFYIRGYGNTDFHLNASQPVSLVYDDVVQENPILKGFPMFDIAQVEVLRGPQGTLFGRNTPAGVVKFDSVTPTNRQEGYVYVSDATYNTGNLEGAYNTPLGGGWAARFSGLYQHRDNWVENLLNGDKLEGYDDGAARFQLAYRPDGDFSALFNIHGRLLNGTARLFRANIIEPGTNALVPDFDPSKVQQDGQNSQHLHSYGGSVRLKWNLANLTLNSITGIESVGVYSRGDIDGGYGASYAPPYGPGFIPFSDETADALPHHAQITQELRVESRTPGPLSWQAGLFYFHESYTINSFAYDSLFGGGQTEYERSRQLNNAWAAFGSTSYAVTDKLSLRAGLRYTIDAKEFDTDEYTASDGTSLPAGSPLHATPHAYNTSWDLSSIYALDRQTNVYARIATGFRAPSVQPASPFGPQSVADSESVLSYELGVKSELFGKRARISFDVYDFYVKNQQLSAVGGQSNQTTLLNAARTDARGAELDLQAYLLRNLLVTLSGSYNFTEIKDPGLAVFPCASCTVLDPAGASPGTVSIDGNPLPQAPKLVGDFTARYSIPTDSGGEYFIYTDWSYRSSVNFFLYQSAEFTGQPLLLGGLRLGYDWHAGDYELAAFSRNITNRIVTVGGIDFNNLTGFINEPRIFGLQFKARF